MHLSSMDFFLNFIPANKSLSLPFRNRPHSFALRHPSGAGCEGEEEVLQGLQCHHLWLGYFNELWATLSDKHDAQVSGGFANHDTQVG